MNELEAQYNQSSASSLGPQSEINKSGESGDSSQDDFTDESDINDQHKRKKVMITRAPRKKQAVTKTRDRAIIEK